jgi:RNA polymerase II subunit A-like phosphatase
VTNSPRSNTRKRLRSLTPSDLGGVINWNSEDDLLRSPLAKRKKIAAGRTGQSTLKQGISADELPKPEETPSKVFVLAHGTPTVLVSGGRSIDEDNEDNEDDSSSSDDSSDDEEDEEDDFLARALEEDAG